MGLRQASTTYDPCPKAENKLVFGKGLAKEVVSTGQKSNKGIYPQKKTKSDINLHKPEFVIPTRQILNKILIYFKEIYEKYHGG